MAAKMDLQPGHRAPRFEAKSDDGTVVRLEDYIGRRVVLYFYPKDNTPGCTVQACGFRDAYDTVEEKGAVVLGVSPDGVESHREFKEKYGLPFPLLVDEDHDIADKYGVWDREKNTIVRSHFLIDQAGRIEDVQYNVEPKRSVERALASI